MSLPHLLLVDDSEAVLAFERAALAGHYALSTATNGREALQKMAELRPAAVLLDLSMPQMDGDEVLARMQQDPALRRIPVIIVSSERKRAEECVAAGARAFLSKPLRGKELLPLVANVLDAVRQEERAGNLAALFVGVGPVEVGLRLDRVETVIHQVATRALVDAPAFAREEVEIYGQSVPVLDLAVRLGVEHGVPLDERKLVVVNRAGARIAVCVDRVRDPVEVPAAELLPADRCAVELRDQLGRALIGAAGGPAATLPIVDAHTLLQPTPRAPASSEPAP